MVNYELDLIGRFVSEMKATTKAKEKALILEHYLLNYTHTISRIYKIAFDSNYQTFITSVPKAKEFSYDKDAYDYFVELTNRIINDNERIKRDEWAQLVFLLQQSVSEKIQAILGDIMIKKLTVGAGVSSYNKIAKRLGLDLLFEHKEMKVSNLSDAEINWESGVMVGTKYDGSNGSYKKGIIYSRNGSPIFTKPMEDALEPLIDSGYVICGELYNKESRQSANGIINSCIKMGYDTKLPVEQLSFAVFDVVPIEDYENGHCAIPYEDRIAKADELIAEINHPKIHVVEQTIVHSMSEAYKMYRDIRSDITKIGYEEGIIINNRDAIYEAKRSKYRARIKDKHTADLYVRGWKQHRTNPSMVGSLLVETSDKRISVWVGSGLKDSHMIDFFERRDNLDGIIVEIEYNHIIKGNNESEFTFYLPVFKRERIDKSDVNSFDNLDGKIL